MYSGFAGDQVASSMAAFYDQRAQQEQEAMNKRREELEQKYSELAGGGYDLKKKDFDDRNKNSDNFVSVLEIKPMFMFMFHLIKVTKKKSKAKNTEYEYIKLYSMQ